METNELKQTDLENKQHTEIVCPHCGSNKVTKHNKPSALYFLIIAILFLLAAWYVDFDLPFKVIGIGSLIIAILIYISNRNSPKGKWEISCDTCNKKFVIDEPDGSVIITNLKNGK